MVVVMVVEKEVAATEADSVAAAMGVGLEAVTVVEATAVGLEAEDLVAVTAGSKLHSWPCRRRSIPCSPVHFQRQMPAPVASSRSDSSTQRMHRR